MDHRRALRRILDAALAAVNGRRAVARTLAATPNEGPVHVVAIGKAAGAMLAGAGETRQVERGLLITKQGHAPDDARRWPGVEVIESGHPVPDGDSLRAGRALLDFLARTPPGARLLFLISGGASSLVEVLPDHLSLKDLQKANDWLLGSGLDIQAMNAVRRRLSRIKGGQLRRFLDDRPTRCLLISDVPGDDPAVIGSGLLVAPSTETLPALPGWLSELIREPGMTDVADVTVEVIACNADARSAARDEARRLGYPVVLHDEAITGDALAATQRLLAEACSGVTIWGGETTLDLPTHPGRGGRNQSMALAAARSIDGRPGTWFLAAGTDGTDGPTDDAGALVDGETVNRGKEAGLDAADCLERADAGRFLAASGDLIRTGPTGTNVMDLYLVLNAP